MSNTFKTAEAAAIADIQDARINRKATINTVEYISVIMEK
jgi:hypothetical protein